MSPLLKNASNDANVSFVQAHFAVAAVKVFERRSDAAGA